MDTNLMSSTTKTKRFKVKHPKRKCFRPSLPHSPLMSVLMWGVNHSVRQLETVNIPVMLLPDDFRSFSKVKVDNHAFNKERMPSHFKIKEYCPLVFRNLRERFGIEDTSFLKSMTERCPRVMDASGRSGCKFFLTRDKLYVIKSLLTEEVELMHSFLKQYHPHVVERHGKTLLPQYLAMYRVTVDNVETYLVVIRNVFSKSMKIHKKYDLKGSTVDREASLKEREKRDPVFKDGDFLKDGCKINLGFECKTEFMSVLEADVTFLTKLHVMDYSLLLGIHRCIRPVVNISDTMITSSGKQTTGVGVGISDGDERGLVGIELTSDDDEDEDYEDDEEDEEDDDDEEEYEEEDDEGDQSVTQKDRTPHERSGGHVGLLNTTTTDESGDDSTRRREKNSETLTPPASPGAHNASTDRPTLPPLLSHNPCRISPSLIGPASLTQSTLVNKGGAEMMGGVDNDDQKSVSTTAAGSNSEADYYWQDGGRGTASRIGYIEDAVRGCGALNEGSSAQQKHSNANFLKSSSHSNQIERRYRHRCFEYGGIDPERDIYAIPSHGNTVVGMEGNTDETVEGGDESVDDGTQEKEIYFLALVDVLTQYGVKKQAAKVAKTVKYGSSVDGISTAEPDQYAVRFLEFVSKAIV